MKIDNKDNINAAPAAEAETDREDLVRVGITQGDVNGIGYELIFKTFAEPTMLELCTPIIYGHAKVAQQHAKALNAETKLYVISSADEAMPGRLNFVNLSDEELKVEYGKTNAEAGHAAFMALEQCVSDAKQGLIDVMVTAPINKQSIQSSNFHFVGHTEYLQDRFGVGTEDVLMIMCSELMRVALVTTHLPVSEIAFAITEEKIENKVRLLYQTLRRDFGLSAPRIAVLALNPHGGDGGVLGHEEDELIAPTVRALSEAGLPVYGPFAADGFFGAASFRHFDGIVAMYHDQGLIPFKTLCGTHGVNFTAGLPFVRTSPDHGTAYDIAGRGVADPTSLRDAIFSAIDIWRNRRAYDEASANPLPKLYVDKKERN